MTISADSEEPPRQYDLSKFIEYDPKEGLIHQSERASIFKATYRFARDDVVEQSNLPFQAMWRFIAKSLNQPAPRGSVALKQFKLLQPNETEGEIDKHTRLCKMIVREMRIWSTLSHLNILPFLGYCGSGTSFALVSPWMEQGPILQYVKKSKEDSKPVDILEVIRGIASGLEYLHDVGIIHADLKCANILASTAGNPLLVDFGISRIISDQHGLWEILNTGNFYGTAAWSAIELLLGSPDGNEVLLQTKASDVWAFGMTTVELLTGKTPYPHPANPQIIAAIVRGALPRMPSDAEHMTSLPQLWKLCERCWLKEPSERPSMTEITRVLYEISCTTYLIDCSMSHGAQVPDSDESVETLRRVRMLQSATQTIIEIHMLDNLPPKFEHEPITCNILKYCHAALNAFLSAATNSVSTHPVDQDKKHASNKIFCLLRSLERQLGLVRAGVNDDAAALIMDEFRLESEISKYISELGCALEVLVCVSDYDVRQNEGFVQDRDKLGQKIAEVEALVEFLCNSENSPSSA